MGRDPLHPGVSGIVQAVANATGFTKDQPNEPPHCDHHRHDLRRRTQANGVVVVVRQCLCCGGNRGAVAKASVTLDTLAAWDDELARRWEASVAEFWQRRREQTQGQGAEWRAFYERYLASPQWSEKRRLVLVRAAGLCECCRLGRAVEVHHTVYPNNAELLDRQPLWELRAVCRPCHERFKGTRLV